MSDDKITVIRYVRKDSRDWKNSNLGGATFAFEVDFNTRKVKCAASVCSYKDNFDKSLGVQVALQRLLDPAQSVEFQYEYVDRFKGLVNACAVYVTETFNQCNKQNKKFEIPEIILRALSLREFYENFTDIDDVEQENLPGIPT
jgi:hypothetical protein